MSALRRVVYAHCVVATACAGFATSATTCLAAASTITATAHCSAA